MVRPVSLTRIVPILEDSVPTTAPAALDAPGDFESADEVPPPLLPHAAARDTVATATGTAIQRPRMRLRCGLSDVLMCMAGSFLRRRPWGAGRAVAALVIAIRSVATLLRRARHHIPRMCVSGSGSRTGLRCDRELCAGAIRATSSLS